MVNWVYAKEKCESVRGTPGLKRLSASVCGICPKYEGTALQYVLCLEKKLRGKTSWRSSWEESRSGHSGDACNYSIGG
jgi:hypothetical protein